MQTIDHDRQFIDGANRFEIHVSNLENMDKKLISPAKAEQDRIAFRRMEVHSNKFGKRLNELI